MKQEFLDILNQEEPGPAVASALEKFLQEDRYLLQVDANERSLTHRIAMYLQRYLPDWHVDCEYNRDGHEPKELVLIGGEPSSQDTNAQTVFPDIIVHRRGSPDNYLVIELKKSTSTVGPKKDLEKLRAFRQQFGYRYALFIELHTRQVNDGIARAQWVVA